MNRNRNRHPESEVDASGAAVTNSNKYIIPAGHQFGNDAKVNTETIPEALKGLNNWLVWRAVYNGKTYPDGTQKPDKVPFDAKTGRYASVTDSNTWSTFGEAVDGVELYGNDGIGFVLTADTGLVGVDLDDCVDEDGEIKSWAWRVIAQLNSYTEYSPSGKGIRIFVWGRKPGTQCRKAVPEGGEFEVYDQGRYLTVTGNRVPNTNPNVEHRQAEIERVYQDVFGDASVPAAKTDAPRVVSGGIRLTDDELLDKARNAENGDKFRRLYDDGDTSDYAGDDSRADLALTSLLAFYSGGEEDQIDRLFRRSALYRPKWDEMHGAQTYGEMTISCAVEGCRNYYSGNGRRTVDADDLKYARASIQAAIEVGTAAAVYECVIPLAMLPLGEFDDVKAEIKERVSSVDKRTLNSLVTKARKQLETTRNRGEYPTLLVNDRPLRDTGQEAIELLEKANVPPAIFVRSGDMCRVVTDERGETRLETMQQPDVISAITDCCDTIAKVSTGVKDVSPPRDLADHILSKTNLPFPAIEGITHIPPVREDGTISQVPGYDPVTRLFYNPPPGFQLPYVSDNPTGEEVREAVAIIDELLCDFPFDCPASKANAVALLLTSVIRSAIGGCVPLAVIDAPSPGSGKSLLASVVNIIATGMAAEFITAPKRDDEWKKSITAVLSDGSSIINIDNVTGTLESDDLASVLTTGRWKDRPFGSNTRTVSYPNRAVWVANGNNIDLGGDLPRRCYWIRLNSKCSKPHERVGFLHPNLVQWTRENRGQILWALLTLFRAWHVAGRPAADTPAMGSFEEWSRIVGSTLSFVGVEGFLVNKDLLWQNSSADQTDWEAFLTELFVKYPSSTDPLATKPVAVKQLVEMFGAENGFDGVIPQAVSFALHESNEPHGAVGLAFKKKAGRRFGEYGLHLEQGPDINHCHTWLVRADREGAGSQ